MKIPHWVSRSIIFGYPIFMTALAALRLTQGQYETGLYMLTTAGLFALNTRLAFMAGKWIAAAQHTGSLLLMMHSDYEKMCNELAATRTAQQVEEGAE